MKNLSIELFSNFLDGSNKPDTYIYEEGAYAEPNDDFVISRSKEGSIISRYGDNVWDFSSYFETTQATVISFEKRISDVQFRAEIKFLMFIYIAFGNGKAGIGYGIDMITRFYNGMCIPLYNYGLKNKMSIKEILSDGKNINVFISIYGTSRGRVKVFLSLFNLLHKLDNEFTNIDYEYSEERILLLRKLYVDMVKDDKQTEVIPTSIFIESIKQRWSQLDEITRYLSNIISFMQYLLNKYPSIKDYRNRKIMWNQAVKDSNVHDLLNKYGVTHIVEFISFLNQIQGTCKHLIHAYTGMRSQEVLSLKANCLVKDGDNDIVRLIGYTTKLNGIEKEVKWVTTNRIEKVIY